MKAAILYAENWGGGGNKTWAFRVATWLGHKGFYRPDVLPLDGSGTYLGMYADLFEQAKLHARSSSERRLSYSQIADRLYKELSSLWSVSPQATHRAVIDVRQVLPRQEYDVIVCTKGIISQIAAVAFRGCKQTSIVNFLTNPGLLNFAIHRPTLADLHLVPEVSWVRALRAIGYPPHMIAAATVDGALLNGVPNECWPPELSGLDANRPMVWIVANHDGGEWTQLLRELGHTRPDVQILCLAVRQPELAEAMDRTLRESLHPQWKVLTWLPEPALHGALSRLEVTQNCVVISKLGPGTVRQLEQFAVPAILWDAGLPMEDWIRSRAADLGRPLVFEELSACLRAALHMLDRPSIFKTSTVPRGILEWIGSETGFSPASDILDDDDGIMRILQSHDIRQWCQ